MPLRPVSELGLVDLTDLASRDTTEVAAPRSRVSPDEKRPERSPRAHDATRQRAPAAPRRAASPAAKAKPKQADPRLAGKEPKRTVKAARDVASGTERRAPSAPAPEVRSTAAATRGVPFLGGVAAVAGGLLVVRTASALGPAARRISVVRPRLHRGRRPRKRWIG